MGNIKQMSTKLANMIAAGEVVERPLNIIKELVENSIDAKANKISIYLKDGGLTEIKVIDNGCGMDEEDIKMCFKPHATSKLLNEYDLFRIKTLGFRGEALASIASVANVSLTSKKIDDKAYNIVYRFGNLISFNETAAETGTTIIVTDLFYNTPARLKYLKTASQELAAITALVDKLSVSSPNVMFVLYNDNRLVARTDGKNNMTSLIGYIYGLEASKKIVDLSFDEQGFSGKLYYIKPDIYRSNKNQMTYIINGRYVRYYALNDLLIEAFKGYLPINKYPILVLYLTIDPLLIDVNIHPTKMDIKFSKLEELSSIRDYNKEFWQDTKKSLEISGICVVEEPIGINIGVAYQTKAASVNFKYSIYDLNKNTWTDISGWTGANWATWYPESGSYWIYVEAVTNEGVTANKCIGYISIYHSNF